MTDKLRAKRVTAADIAKVVGVSRATVGFVLNSTAGQTISEPTRRKVLAAAAQLGYQPHASARALASGQSKIILLVVPDWPIEYSMSSHLHEAAVALDRAGFTMVTWTPYEGGAARPLWETLQPDVVMGMVPFTPAQIEAIARTGAKMIIPDAREQNDTLGFALGPAAQIQHLAERGHRSVLFAGTSDPRLSSLSEDRFETAATAASRAGVSLILDSIDIDGTAPDVVGWQKSGVTAVAAYNDTIAAAVASTALRAGMTLPSDLAIIGHDNTPMARLMVPSLSTIDVSADGLGRYLAELALHAAVGAPHPAPSVDFSAKVVQRETT